MRKMETIALVLAVAVVVSMGAVGMVVADSVDEPGVGPEYKPAPTAEETEHETERVRPVYDRQENSNM